MSTRPGRLRRLALTAAATAGTLLLSGCSIYDLPLPGGADPGEDPMEVTVMFRDVLDLVPQSNVKLDDVTIGKVTGVDLDGYVARVTVAIPKDIDLPENVRADIRQTSLLGEKFISLSKPDQPSGSLDGKDTIGLSQTGRNPEVEEVLGALSAVLNGGGVAQLKTIAHEMNQAFGGREEEVRAVVRHLGDFMGQLDQNKGAIVTALENLNRLSLELRRNDPTIKSALDNIPAALASIDRQRADLVAMLEALDRLSGVGVEVIRASKAGTIDSLKALSPVLHEFAKAGQDLPNAFQALITYPFVDESVARDPQVARNLHMGDFVNLSARLDIDLNNLPGLPGLPPPPGGGGGGSPLPELPELPSLPSIPGVPQLPGLPLGSGGSSGAGGGGGVLDPVLGGFGLGRPATAFDLDGDPFRLGARGVDPDLGTLLLQGVAFK